MIVTKIISRKKTFVDFVDFSLLIQSLQVRFIIFMCAVSINFVDCLNYKL